MLASLQDYVDRHRFDLGVEDAHARVGFRLRCGYGGAAGKVHLFGTVPGLSRPVFFAKAVRDRRWAGALYTEFEMLRRLERVLPAAAGSGFPRALAFDRVGGDYVLITSVLPGRDLEGLYGRSGWWSRGQRARLATRVAGWLGRLQRVLTTGTTPVAEEEAEALVAWPVARALHDPVARGPVRDYLERMADRAWARLRSRAIPRVVAHGDLWPGNVLLRGDGGIGVVDWEGAREDVLPFGDLWSFLFDAAVLPAGNDPARARRLFRDAFLGEGTLPGARAARWVQAAVEAHAAALGTAPADAWSFFAMALVSRLTVLRAAGVQAGAARAAAVLQLLVEAEGHRPIPRARIGSARQVVAGGR